MLCISSFGSERGLFRILRIAVSKSAFTNTIVVSSLSLFDRLGDYVSIKQIKKLKKEGY